MSPSSIRRGLRSKRRLKKSRRSRDELYQENVALRQEIDETSMFEENRRQDAPRCGTVLKQVETVASSESTVIIYGETGNGKGTHRQGYPQLESAAQQCVRQAELCVHSWGASGKRAFRPRERRLHGSDLRSASGASSWPIAGPSFWTRLERFPLDLQPKLLRVLRGTGVRAAGKFADLCASEARLIAATNRDLAKMVEDQTFRADLFYRLNVIPILVPPLRERPEDVPCWYNTSRNCSGRRDEQGRFRAFHPKP